MYQHATLPLAAGSAATLPFTGFSVLWILLAAFALLAAGAALWRVVPRREK